MECITLANDIISMYSTNMVIGGLLFMTMAFCLGVIFEKALNKEKVNKRLNEVEKVSLLNI